MTQKCLSRYRINYIRLKNTDLSAEERDKLEKENRSIDDFVSHISVEDIEIKQIIEWRYIKGKRKLSWQAIAMRLGYQAEHTPKRKIEKYLKKSRKL